MIVMMTTFGFVNAIGIITNSYRSTPKKKTAIENPKRKKFLSD
jgi:hypothetical protein